MSDITVSESGDYFYIMQGDSDADCWPQYKEAANPWEEIIIRLCEKVVEQNKQLDQQAKSIDELVYRISEMADYFEAYYGESDGLREAIAIANKYKTNKQDK